MCESPSLSESLDATLCEWAAIRGTRVTAPGGGCSAPSAVAVAGPVEGAERGPADAGYTKQSASCGRGSFGPDTGDTEIVEGVRVMSAATKGHHQKGMENNGARKGTEKEWYQGESVCVCGGGTYPAIREGAERGRDHWTGQRGDRKGRGFFRGQVLQRFLYMYIYICVCVCLCVCVCGGTMRGMDKAEAHARDVGHLGKKDRRGGRAQGRW